MASKQD